MKENNKILKIFSMCFIILLVIISVINIVDLYFESSKTGSLGFYYEYKYNYNLGTERIKLFVPFIFVELILLIKIIINKRKQKNNKILYNILFILALILIIVSGNLLKKERNKSVVYKLDYADNFNTKFSRYEGIRTGSQVKELIEVINESNVVENEGKDRIVSVNNKRNITQYVATIDNNKKYKVECEKLDGVVSNINIYCEEQLIEINGI